MSKTETDLAIIGGGPAGLAGAIMAASEGLTVTLLEKHHLGGQSAYSPLIENVPGWPQGISGPELTALSKAQAEKFGARLLVGAAAEELALVTSGEKLLTVTGGDKLLARAVLVSTGMVFRNMPVPGGDKANERGICFDSCDIASHRWAGKVCYVVGAANSAGQAALFLARHCSKVRLLVRGTSLTKGMSKYLVDRILAEPKIEVLFETSVAGHYPGVVLVMDRAGKVALCHDCDGLFVYIGSEPCPKICEALVTDDKGFVTADPYSLASNLPGVFVAGDIRAGSVKRVTTAYGDAIRAVSNVHQYLAAPRKVTGAAA
jgi:thioredoxin reductase (NADPH)